MEAQSLFTSGITNLLIALASVITAIGVVWVNVIVAKAKTKVENTAVKVELTAESVEKKTDEIAQTTKVTLGHVNSAATEMRAQIASLLRDNEQLRILLSENKQIAAVLAASTAARVRLTEPSPSTEVLTNIEQNTKQTAENTETK